MLYLSGQHILFGKSSLEILEKELTNKSIFSDKNIISRKDTFENIPKIIDNINLKNINFSYPDNGLTIFKNLSYNFSKGKIYCLVGESGSGKSTFINLIMGFIRPQSGEISFNKNQSIFENLSMWQKNISYLFKKSFFIK